MVAAKGSAPADRLVAADDLKAAESADGLLVTKNSAPADDLKADDWAESDGEDDVEVTDGLKAAESADGLKADESVAADGLNWKLYRLSLLIV